MSIFRHLDWIPGLLATLTLLALPCSLWTGCEQTDDDATDDDAGDDDTGDDDTDDDDTGDDDTGGELDLSVCAAENGPFSLDIDNTYLPFSVGAVHVLEGLEGGTDPIRVQFTVLDETREIDGVTTRRVEEREWEDDVLASVENHYVVQAPNGTVCYYGADGWEAGGEVMAGILMPANPAVGLVFDMIHIPGTVIETVEITAVGETVDTPAGTFDDCVTILEPGPSVKKFAAGIGMIYDDGIELQSY